MSWRHRVSSALLATARRLRRFGPVHALGRAAWDLYWGAHFALRRRFGGRWCEVTTRVGQMTIDLEDHGVGRSLYWYGAYEPAESALLEKLAQPGMTVIDVGANIGYHTLLLSRRVGAAGKVVAVEPVPGNLRLLEENVARNAGDGNVVTLPYALTDRAGEVTLSLDAHNAGMHRLASVEASGGSTRVTVSATTLDALATELGLAPDLIKMDVEGAEGRVLAGAAETLARDHLMLLMELNPEALSALGTPPRQLLADLAGHGFTAYRLDGAHLAPASDEFLETLSDGSRHANLLFSRHPPAALAD